MTVVHYGSIVPGMPTIFTHPAVPLAIAWGLGNKAVLKPLLAAGVVASIVPDLDVLAFRLGIPYAAEFGHRGFSHSLLLALIVAFIGASMAGTLRSTFQRTFWFLFIAMASHGLLDAFTNGGLGVAFLWPFSGERFFAPIHPVEVAPLGFARFLSQRGAAVLWSEFLWIWMPLFSVAAVAAAFQPLNRLARKYY